VACFLAGKARIPLEEQSKIKLNYVSIVYVLLLVTTFLMGVTFFWVYMTGRLRMGSESAYLPFRLAGWIFYIRAMLIPAFLLVLIWCSDQAGIRKCFHIGIVLLIIHGVSDMLLRSSRRSLLILFIMLTMLFLISGRMSKQRVLLIVFILLCTILLFPIISDYRSIRIGDYAPSISFALKESIAGSLYELSNFAETLAAPIRAITFRSGMRSLLPIVGSGIEPLGSQVFEISPTKVFTIEVLGYSPYLIHASAPSVIGWLYLAGGNFLAISGIFIFTVLAWIFWCILVKAKLHCLPVAQTMFLIFLFSNSMEGTLEGLYLQTLVLVGTIVACELVMRCGFWVATPVSIATEVKW